jgi:superfamily II DNA helicase RecQ
MQSLMMRTPATHRADLNRPNLRYEVAYKDLMVAHTALPPSATSTSTPTFASGQSHRTTIAAGGGAAGGPTVDEGEAACHLPEPAIVELEHRIRELGCATGIVYCRTKAACNNVQGFLFRVVSARVFMCVRVCILRVPCGLHSTGCVQPLVTRT